MRDPLPAADDEPLYNIGAVGRMTGVPVATLRVWERRYGFPRSVRTPGGHRIFSEREVERVRWVRARIEEGLQAGQAVQALAHVERQPAPAIQASGPLVALAGDAGRRPAHPGAPPGSGGEAPAPSPTLAACRERFSASLRQHDLGAADRILGETLVLFPLEAMILDVIRPALADLGEGWEKGEVSVASEHLASYYLRQRLLQWLAAGPPPRLVPPAVLACAPGDWHETGLLMLAVLLGRQRWPVTYLGPSVPLPDLADFVAQARPPVVVLAATIEETALALADWPRYLPEAAATGRPAVCFGGRIFSLRPDLRASMRGQFLGEGLADGVATLNQVLRRVTGETG